MRSEELNLKQWLTGDEYELKEREDLLIRELDGLSSQRSEY